MANRHYRSWKPNKTEEAGWWIYPTCLLGNTTISDRPGGQWSLFACRSLENYCRCFELYQRHSGVCRSFETHRSPIQGILSRV